MRAKLGDVIRYRDFSKELVITGLWRTEQNGGNAVLLPKHGKPTVYNIKPGKIIEVKGSVHGNVALQKKLFEFLEFNGQKMELFVIEKWEMMTPNQKNEFRTNVVSAEIKKHHEWQAH